MSQPAKNLFAIQTPEIVDVGTLPELGVVPEKMHAYAIRPESPLMCPARPMSTKRLPQVRAISRARSTAR